MAEVAHTAHLPGPPGAVSDLVDTLEVLRCEWQGDKRYLAECILAQALDLKLPTLLLALKESWRQRSWDMESRSHK